ncbi:MAG: hypothetical protein Q9M40_03120 [Sulfurimonas sp.]|nr:hypothetical protein [Sulfurimonas sp.]
MAIDSLEEELFKENAFKASKQTAGSLQGEDVAKLFYQNDITQGIEKLIEYEITPEDFFGFVEYHYDEEHPDEELIGMFTEGFIADIHENYKLINQK